jgi:hypothetical protein
LHPIRLSRAGPGASTLEIIVPDGNNVPVFTWRGRGDLGGRSRGNVLRYENWDASRRSPANSREQTVWSQELSEGSLPIADARLVVDWHEIRLKQAVAASGHSRVAVGRPLNC